jgi:cell division protein FtsX
VLARRQQVETMVRLGATDRFIATPFVIEALIEALVASGFALGSMYAIQMAVASRLVGGLQFLPWQGTLLYLGSVLLLAWLATMLALARVMRAIGP